MWNWIKLWSQQSRRLLNMHLASVPLLLSHWCFRDSISMSFSRPALFMCASHLWRASRFGSLMASSNRETAVWWARGLPDDTKRYQNLLMTHALSSLAVERGDSFCSSRYKATALGTSSVTPWQATIHLEAIWATATAAKQVGSPSAAGSDLAEK